MCLCRGMLCSVPHPRCGTGLYEHAWLVSLLIQGGFAQLSGIDGPCKFKILRTSNTEQLPCASTWYVCSLQEFTTPISCCVVSIH